MYHYFVISVEKQLQLCQLPHLFLCMYEFLHWRGYSLCGASASYMIWDEEKPPGNKNLFFLQVVCPIHFRLSQVPQSNPNFSLVLGNEAAEDHRARPWPPLTVPNSSLHHPSGGYS